MPIKANITLTCSSGTCLYIRLYNQIVQQNLSDMTVTENKPTENEHHALKLGTTHQHTEQSSVQEYQ